MAIHKLRAPITRSGRVSGPPESFDRMMSARHEKMATRPMSRDTRQRMAAANQVDQEARQAYELRQALDELEQTKRALNQRGMGPQEINRHPKVASLLREIEGLREGLSTRIPEPTRTQRRYKA